MAPCPMVAAPVVAGTSQKKSSSNSKFKVCRRTTNSSKLPGKKQLPLGLVALAALAT